MLIGFVPDPHNWSRWEQAKAYLEPARARGDFECVWEPDELLWAVLDGDELLACATAWLSVDGYAEVKLVGGRDHRRWIEQLNEEVGRAALEAGATELRAWGRSGWVKALRALGWDTFTLDDGSTGYRRRLEN